MMTNYHGGAKENHVTCRHGSRFHSVLEKIISESPVFIGNCQLFEAILTTQCMKLHLQLSHFCIVFIYKAVMCNLISYYFDTSTVHFYYL